MSRIVIDENRCKGCGLCTTVCPFDLIRMAEHFNAKGYRPAEYIGRPPGVHRNAPASDATDRQCTGCANCATMCPDVAIVVYRTQSDRRERVSAPAEKPIVEPIVPTREASQATEQRGYATSGPDRVRHSSTANRGNGREQQNIQSATGEPRA
jgi:2-oxoglutarate ferredoxin oxidoreductase subunit delta